MISGSLHFVCDKNEREAKIPNLMSLNPLSLRSVAPARSKAKQTNAKSKQTTAQSIVLFDFYINNALWARLLTKWEIGKFT